MRSVESGFQRLVDGRACFLTGGAVVSVPFTVSDHSHGLSPLTGRTTWLPRVVAESDDI